MTHEARPYEVRTDVYCGPLDMLVKLVVSQEVDIWEVSLSRLVDDFLAAMAVPGSAASDPARSDAAFDIETASEFAVLAATLIELKCRRLLPERPVELDIEEELAAYGVRDAVLARLVARQTFSAAAGLLRERWNAAMARWPRAAGPPEHFVEFVPDLLAGTSRDDIASAMERVIASRPLPRLDLSHVRAPSISVEEAAALIIDRLSAAKTASFRELTCDVSERVVVVVYFLALLELFGAGLVELSQAERFGDIGVEWIGDAARARAALSDTVFGEDAA